MSATAGTDAPGPLRLFEFADPASRAGWVAVNDVVTGGRSRGGPRFVDDALRFSGTLSLENNGGFSSLRHIAQLDLAAYAGLRLRVRGDGRTYQLRVRTDARYLRRPVSFTGDFETRVGEWRDVQVPFDTLRASFRGRLLPDYRFDAPRIEMIGIMLADKNPGEVVMDVSFIEAYR